MSWPSGDVRREARVARLLDAAKAGGPEVNGIASVRVSDSGGTIALVCELIFPPPASGGIVKSDVSITGGVRRPQVAVTDVSVAANILTITVAERGDFSIYELSLRRDGEAPPGFDPLLSSIPVGFRLQCQQGFDCKDQGPSLEPPPATAPIDYQARDYQGFRRLMLDRFAQLSPGWNEPGPTSLEITLIELLAHFADRISYAQDAVATEAYLDTCRRRISAKRHARLIDYRMSDGRNARAFVHVRLRAPMSGAPPLVAPVSLGTRFMTRALGVAPASPDTPEVATARTSGAEIFEALENARLSSAHNRILIHDWTIGDDRFELAVGTTEMYVVDEGRLLSLTSGDLLLIEEVLDKDGNSSPDPARRHVVRLTEVKPLVDPVGGRDSGGNPMPLEILRLRWDAADAVPMRLPLVKRTSTDAVDGIPPNSPDQPTLVARGNIVLVDHGEWRGSEDVLPRRRPGRRRFTMPLSEGPLTMAPAHNSTRSAAEAMKPSTAAVPQLTVTRAGDPWKVVDELFDTFRGYLVLDVGDDGRAELRTGHLSDNEFDEGLPFTVRYRLGNGTRGNVGAEAIAHLLTDPHRDRAGDLVAGLGTSPADVELVRNPLPACLGAEQETIDDVRLRAPMAIRRPDRAVTGSDYAAFLMQDPDVAAARAIEQWTGSSRAIVLMVDLLGGRSMTNELETRFRDRLERVRLAGHVLEFRNPSLVPIEIAMHVCVRPGMPRDDVLLRLSRLFSSGRLADGSPALFHPDNFGFGDSLRLSRLYAAAQNVDGVSHVEITSLRRQGVAADDAVALERGTLDFGPYEIPLLTNDPNFPDRGVVHFALEGGA